MIHNKLKRTISTSSKLELLHRNYRNIILVDILVGVIFIPNNFNKSLLKFFKKILF